MPFDHEQKFVALAGFPDVEIGVDLEIVDLIVALCDLGLTTRMSCQDNLDDRVWICFQDSWRAEKFLKLIAEKSERLQLFVIHASTERYDKSQHAWKQIDRWWVDSAVFVRTRHTDERWDGQLEIGLSVRFPRSHLDEVTKIVVDHRDLVCST